MWLENVSGTMGFSQISDVTLDFILFLPGASVGLVNDDALPHNPCLLSSIWALMRITFPLDKESAAGMLALDYPSALQG